MAEETQGPDQQVMVFPSKSNVFVKNAEKQCQIPVQ